jgi:inosine-uridine nucleoside N-ribohydrolase
LKEKRFYHVFLIKFTGWIRIMEKSLILFLALIAAALSGGTGLATPLRAQKVPVILDTDIGDDIDDTWALIMLLKSPELDLKLVTTTHGKAVYRAKLVARLLEAAGRTDIPIGLGAGGHDGDGRQQAWVEDYDLDKFPGKVVQDGVQALIDTAINSPEPVTLISIGPSTTVSAAIVRRPDIASRAVFVGMQGAVRKGYDGGPVGPEYNVRENIPAARKALLAPWRKTVITPLDTCGLVRLSRARFQALTKSPDKLIAALLENYRIWANKESVKDLTESSVLFDTVAVYLALPGPKPHLRMEELAINISPDGMTALDPAGARMSVATAWRDLDGYEDFLVKVLLSVPAAV